MIFFTLGKKAIKGKRINKALEKLLRSNPVGDSPLDGFLESTSSFEFVPRCCDWHYRPEFIFFCKKDGTKYLFRIIPLSPTLNYKEIGIIPYRTKNYDTKTAEPIIFNPDEFAEITYLSCLCWEIISTLLRELGVLQQ